MDLPPAAPTPPVNNGGMPSSNADRTANLLNLLKFSGNNAHQQKQQQIAQAQAQAQPKPDVQSPPQSEPQQFDDQASQHSHQSQGLANAPQQQQRPPLSQSHSQNDNQQRPPISQTQIHQEPLPGLPQHQYPTLIHQPAPTGADPTGLLAALMRGAHEAEDSPKPPPAQLHAQRQAPAQAPAPAPAAAPVPPFSGEPPSANTTSYLLGLLNRPKPSQTEQSQPSLLTETSRSDNLTPQSPVSLTNEPPRAYGRDEAYSMAQKYQQAQAQIYAHQQQAQHGPPQNLAPAHESGDNSALYRHLLGSLSHQQSHDSEHHPVQQQHQHQLQITHSGHSSSHGSQGYERGVQTQQHIHHPHLHHHNSAMSPPHTQTSLDRSSSHQSQLSQQSHPSHHSSKSAGAAHLYDQYESEKPVETVAEAVDDLSHHAHHDASEAVDRAEAQQQLYQEHSATAEISREPLNELDYDSAEQSAHRGVIYSQVAEEVFNVDDPPVADSWESADQDEIVVIEEVTTPPIKVFNFPMKPFISLSLRDDFSQTRPEFRPQSVMDIARLKKEFDQTDRNLYTASLSYMTYGMSKQGGMRVIRQDDGKDAKIFTDTKDRIFNLAISSNLEDSEAIPSEAILGTGVSGTVYWVQLKDGGKDHIDDTHLEQYGFALPPISFQEGDAPGGVLKTRARASTSHPEYFAVGRGKSISIVWPSYIMQNNLFKPGHDRVVDTEALQKHCSLRINTGKAGKDFTFSQDDTVVVSLDKSGRVKFWDVRDLTARKEGSDPRQPVPAQSNLEVKEPLMTLASTPEGEKAWPTSVLLLDKQRPYQKNCALRYMIVGMKQNHTLQLWDLALGKPVQEFNLPHSKESDAVCSVMYHPASGMIVIGHPTRNSIYFAHLSAPKYNLKGVSQAEYIQRLVSQDTSIPQPDSTAVISGVREYSFGSRGVLRSLDLLPTPAMDQDPDEPTLFELYAMHSKGVLCLLVKQTELGWNKDNKVIEPVDAATEGLVTVSKLKPPQPAESGENTARTLALPHRGAKEVVHAPGETPTADLASSRGVEAGPVVRVKHEVKEAEPPTIQAPKENQSEKHDRKSRKKKTAAANQTETTTNGVHPRAAGAPKDVAGARDVVISSVSSETVEAALAGVELRLGATVDNSVSAALKAMQLKLDQGAEAREAIYEENQKQLLGMVSEVLNENVQSVLGSLIQIQFQDIVVPAISSRTNQAVVELVDKFQPQVAASVVKEIQKNLSQSVTWALRNKEITNSIADRVSDSVTVTVTQNVTNALAQQVSPIIGNMVSQNTQRFIGDLHASYNEQLKQLQAQHVADTRKIDQLMSHVTRLTEMVGTMVQTQSQMQEDFVKFRQQPPVHELPGAAAGAAAAAAAAGGLPSHDFPHQGYGHNSGPKMSGSHAGTYTGNQAPTHAGPYMGSPQYSRGHQNVTSPRGSGPGSEPVAGSTMSGLTGNYNHAVQKEDPQVEQELQQHIHRIEQLVQEGSLQDAMLQWIQSGHEEEIFRRCLSRYPPSQFAELPQIMLLVVIATISKNLKSTRGLKEEIDWIDMAVKAYGENMMNFVEYDNGQGYNEVVESTTQTLQLLNSRLQPLLDQVRNGYPTDPLLVAMDRGKMEWIIQSSTHILQSLGRRYE